MWEHRNLIRICCEVLFSRSMEEKEVYDLQNIDRLRIKRPNLLGFRNNWRKSIYKYASI